jgi:iron complex outermembrane recepter protein
MRNTAKSLFQLSLLSAAIMSPPSVFAQDGIVLEEVIVTAQRREQNLQDVPVSVTAFGGSTLERMQASDAQSYLQLVPNVSFTEDGQVGSRGVSIAMRGVSNINTDESAFIQSIGVYLDEFSVASVANGTVNPQLIDLDRIEVLRGPQGTYFGRNAVGGALNLTTRKPHDQLGFKVTGSARTYETTGDQYDIGIIANVPISDTFMVRGAFYYEDNSGIVENIVPGGGDSAHDYTTGRLALRWMPSDATTIDAMVMVSEEEQGIDETVPAGVWDTDTVATFGLPSPGIETPVDEGTGFWPDNRDKLSHTAIDERNDNEGTVAILNVSHELSDTMTLKWVTGYIDTENEKVFDNDLIAADVVNRYQKKESESWSTELRLEFITDNFDWVSGFLYSEDEINKVALNESGVVNGGLGVVTGPDRETSTGAPIGGLPPEFLTQFTPDGMAPLCLGCFVRTNELESWAIFTDFTWHVSDRLDLIVGARYTEDEVDAIYDEFGLFRTPRIPDPDDPTGLTSISTVGNETFTDVSPRFSFGYAMTDDARIYGTISKGYKAGGFTQDFESDAGVAINEPFDEEELWNYELGVKSEWLDNRLRFNASAFLLQWDDLQLETFFFAVPGDATSNVQKTINVREAEALGFELELLAAVTEGLTITAGLGYTDTEIKSDDTATLSGGLTVELQNEPLPRSPELTWNLTADYQFDLFGGEAFLRGEWIYRDEQFSTIEDVTYKQTSNALIFADDGSVLGQVPDRSDGFPFINPDYHLINLRAGYITSNNLELTVFVNNAFDEEYYAGAGENFGLSGFRLRPHPRYVGVSIAYTFGEI